jgi:transcriptional regulator with XRE-family HTH domain
VSTLREDEATVGERLRALRGWRGMTLAEVGGLAGVSAAYLSMVERGLRTVDRRSTISALAAALRVSETDLTGGPHLTSDHLQSAPHAAIPALRAALETNRLTQPALERARPLEDLASEVTGRIMPLRAMCNYEGVGALLPDVIDELYVHIAEPHDEMARRMALEMLIEACVAATDIANTLHYRDLAHVAALKAEAAAELLDDPVQLGKTAVLGLFAFPRELSWARRLDAAERAANALEPAAVTALGFQVLGMLTLQAALAASVLQKADLTTFWLREAARLAERVPDSLEGNWQFFSATNVAIWRLAVSVERSDMAGVLEVARTVDQERLTVRCRKADFLVETARGLARDPRTSADAVTWMRRAEETAPQRVRNSAVVRETVAYLLTRAKATAGGRELRGMAARMGVAH